ncbi:hypothetical protein AB434_0824 [Heyndrickxia coagulans]|uniref:Uncharacterized protein n=1 Tax=Heyndrickxia coagulans TaxID=1398 RepID=A0AAN0WAI8_HEYCO|nr:hypothetical protein SB48_HM08orf00520 [Heyndrickxia coagulans]AKN53229.1 hypothetical protein AB434_0824 [Heyndrickxia coagulans]KYC58678.1 hypothetical protein B4100_1709 [Heyndrickxia coagulans]
MLLVQYRNPQNMEAYFEGAFCKTRKSKPGLGKFVLPFFDV